MSVRKGRRAAPQKLPDQTAPKPTLKIIGLVLAGKSNQARVKLLIIDPGLAPLAASAAAEGRIAAAGATAGRAERNINGEGEAIRCKER